MKVAIGLKAHSGWGVLVAVGLHDGKYHTLERQRIELIEEKDATWAKRPYHAAEGLEANAASTVITLGIAEAQRSALREMRAALRWSQELGQGSKDRSSRRDAWPALTLSWTIHGTQQPVRPWVPANDSTGYILLRLCSCIMLSRPHIETSRSPACISI